MNSSVIRPASVPASALLSTWTEHDWRDGMKLDDVSALDRITARTCYSTYEIVISNPATGEILVRGGRFFPEFTPARLAGASMGGSLLKVRSMYVGFRIEFALEGRVIITSPVRKLAVQQASVRSGELM